MNKFSDIFTHTHHSSTDHSCRRESKKVTTGRPAKGRVERTGCIDGYVHLNRLLVVVYTELAAGIEHLQQNEVDQRERPFR